VAGEHAQPGRLGVEDDSPGPGAENAGGGAYPTEAEAEPHPVDEAAQFGRPGRPLSRGPFVFGFLFGLGFLLAVALFLMVRNAGSILVLILIALFLAIGLNPAVQRLQRWGLGRGLAVGLIGLAIVLLLCGGLFSLVPPLVGQTNQFVQALPDYIESLKRSETLSNLNERYDVIDRLAEAAGNLATAGNVERALGGVFGGARLIFGTLFNVLTVLILTIYFLAGFERLKRGAYQLVPASRRDRVELIADEILSKVGAYMVGALAIALLAGGSTFLFLVIAGIAYPFALAFVVAVCDLIPQIGATLGAIVVVVAGFATSVPVGVASLIFFLVYQQLENYLIYPKVMKRSVKVSDLAAIVAALLGVALIGVIGALIAIPAVAAIQLIAREVVIPRQRVR
jgi:predicted PurR-regulated permease PerM